MSESGGLAGKERRPGMGRPGTGKTSAGLMMYRLRDGAPEVFLVHPGGPYNARKDAGVWTIPKGGHEPGEEPLAAAKREFHEETGFTPGVHLRELGSIRQAGGKVVLAWAFEGDCDPAKLVSNTCQIEWPPRSGQRMTIPEVDAGRWFTIADARHWMKDTQQPFLDRLVAFLAEPEAR